MFMLNERRRMFAANKARALWKKHNGALSEGPRQVLRMVSLENVMEMRYKNGEGEFSNQIAAIPARVAFKWFGKIEDEVTEADFANYIKEVCDQMSTQEGHGGKDHFSSWINRFLGERFMEKQVEDRLTDQLSKASGKEYLTAEIMKWSILHKTCPTNPYFLVSTARPNSTRQNSNDAEC